MIYKECMNQFAKLKELLVFQERRNFFNKIEDKHLNASIKVIDAVIEKNSTCELEYNDLAEIMNITVKIISLLNVSDEVKEQLKSMNRYAIKLKENNLDIK